MGAYPLRGSKQSESTRSAQLSVAAKDVGSTVHLYVGSPLSDSLSLCCGRMAPEVSEEGGSYASRFYHWFSESSKSCLFFVAALPGLIDTLVQLLA